MDRLNSRRLYDGFLCAATHPRVAAQERTRHLLDDVSALQFWCGMLARLWLGHRLTSSDRSECRGACAFSSDSRSKGAVRQKHREQGTERPQGTCE